MYLKVIYGKMLLVFMTVLFAFEIVANEANQCVDISSTLIQLGTLYGGWVIPKAAIDNSSICYCFGAGEDISFDLALIKYCGTNVYCFDPTPRSIDHIDYIKEKIAKEELAYCNNSKVSYAIDEGELKKLNFFPLGIWNEDSIVKFYTPQNQHHVSHSIVNMQKTNDYFEAPCKRLSTIMQELGHNKVDLLKLDIEGAEYEVLSDMLSEQIYPSLLCVEFHDIKGNNKQCMLNKLQDAGYVILHISHKKDYSFIYNDLPHAHSADKIIKKGYSTQSLGQMNIYEYALDQFSKEPLLTEYTAYCLLKERPLDCNVNYVAIPWSVLINKKQLHSVPKIKLQGGFTICQHIRFESIIPLLKEMGIDTLFTPHAIKGKKYEGITVLPFPHLAVNAPEPASKKDIWYSFIGFNTHWTRSIIFNMPQTEKIIIKQRNKWHFWLAQEQRECEAQEYMDVLARSRFSLCPRGTGPGTLRFWESLRAGAIPVLIADDMAMPDGFDWSSCIIPVAECDVKNISTILQKVTPEQEEMMRKNCLSCYKQFSGHNFVSIIRVHYVWNNTTYKK